MGVITLASTNLELSDVLEHSANSKWAKDSGGEPDSIKTARDFGAIANVSSTNTAMRGGSGLDGFRQNQSGTTSSYRFVQAQAVNCTVNVSYPTGAGGTLWRSGATPTSNRSFITHTETNLGNKLYCKGINYTDYSFMTFTANNFSYGYQAGSWKWYTAAGSYYALGGTGSTYTLYASTATNLSNYILEHEATQGSAPTVFTNSASHNSNLDILTVTGNVSSDGGATITQRGVVISANTTSPTLQNNFDSATQSGTTGNFTVMFDTSQIIAGPNGTTYYCRAYATNSVGTSYGSTKSALVTPSGGGGFE